MKNQHSKSSGSALIFGSLLIVATMILHPSGGNIEHIIKISNIIMITHAMAIFCLPIISYGFYGLTNMLLDKNGISILAFIIISFGLIAVMFAAVFNGLVLPQFAVAYSDSVHENINVLRLIIDYGFSINKSLDYVFITACCLSIILWSGLIIRSLNFPKWIGYFGMALIICALISVLSGIGFTSLIGFRIFVFGLVGWILAAGSILIKSKEVDR